jgi:hypothetical protein
MPAAERLRPILVGALIAGCLLLASRGLSVGYSYWADELFTVAASQDSWHGMVTNWLLPDTHPPLYLVMLKLWMGFMGSGETATRCLSFLAAALTLVAAALLTRGRSLIRQVVVVAFIGCSSAFAFYGQEARNYALVLLLSSVLTGVTLQLRNPVKLTSGASQKRFLRTVFYASAILLSLTHYFAWLFVFILAVVDLVEARIDRLRSRVVLLMLAISIWPPIHWLASRGSGKRDNISWIDVQPIKGTFEVMMRGVFDVFPSPSRNLFAGLAILALVLILAFMSRRRPMPSVGGSDRNTFRSQAGAEILFLLSLLALFVGIVGSIDLILPISTPRNFIVALPAMAYLVGNGAEISSTWGVRSYLPAALVLSLILSRQLQRTEERMTSKLFPLMNYKGLADFLGHEGVCARGCRYQGVPRLDASRIYFGRFSLSDETGAHRQPASQPKTPLIMVRPAGVSPLDVLERNPGYSCWEPVQSYPNSVVSFLPPGSPAKPSGKGMRACGS